MKKYTDGKRIIQATEMAYKTIYKQLGFQEVVEISEEIKESKSVKQTSKKPKRGE